MRSGWVGGAVLGYFAVSCWRSWDLLHVRKTPYINSESESLGISGRGSRKCDGLQRCGGSSYLEIISCRGNKSLV